MTKEEQALLDSLTLQEVAEVIEYLTQVAPKHPSGSELLLELAEDLKEASEARRTSNRVNS